MAKKIARQFALMIVEFVGCLPQANMDMEIEKLVSFNLWKLVCGGGDLAASTNAHIIVVIF